MRLGPAGIKSHFAALQQLRSGTSGNFPFLKSSARTGASAPAALSSRRVSTPSPATSSGAAFSVLTTLAILSTGRRLAVNGRRRQGFASLSMASPAKKAKVEVRDSLKETDGKGAFKRVDSVFRNFIEEGGDFPPESGRYHLYVANACPWANRCHMILTMKGLEDAISVSVVHPVWHRTKPDVDEHAGWIFKDPMDEPIKTQTGKGSFSCEGCVPDTVNGAKTVRELYELADDTGGKYTVPILWDKKKKTIVNNESTEIVRMFNNKFNKFAKNPNLDLFPANLEKEMADLDAWIYPNINNGVYRCGFATTQEAYEEAYGQLFAHLDKAEEILSKQRYLCGSTFTGVDLRLWMTLVRFDPVYVVYFKCYGKRIEEYPNLWNYTKEIYQMKGVGSLTNMAHIKNHYFASHPTLNIHAIVPARVDADLNAPHDRDSKFPVGATK